MKGLAGALRRLSALPRRAEGAARAAAEEAARETADRARRAVPVRTGALRASIGWTPTETGAEAAAGAAHAACVEWGTCREPARPFLLPAARASDYAARAQRQIREAMR